MKEFVIKSGGGGGVKKIDYRAELNEEQCRVVEEGNGYCLVLAGAGSGKTRTITHRVAWVLEQGIDPGNILLLTFTNKAAKEMIARVEHLLGVFPTGLWAGTFHSIANRLLRKYGDYTPYGRSFTILDEDDSHNLLKLCIKEVKGDLLTKRFPSPAVIKGIISYAANARVSLVQAIERRAPQFEEIESEIGRVAERYSAEKLQQKAMDFDDLQVVLLELLQSNERIAAAVSGQFSQIMVDEFQDTNAVQFELVRLLSSVHGNLIAVGDDAQSIYSFRAADVRNILDFPAAFSNAKIFKLVVNYRSTPQILAVANAVIAGNEDQFQKELVACRASGEKPNLIAAGDDRQEAKFITQKILEQMDNGVSLNDIAVLFRAAFHSQALEFELLNNNIPYEYRGGQKFFERSHIKDCLAHLRAVLSPQDGVAWIRALQIYPGLGLTTAGKIAALVRGRLNLSDVIGTPVKLGAKAAAGWQNCLTVMRAMVDRTPSDMIKTLAASASYKEYIEASFDNPRDRLEDLEQLATFAGQYDDAREFLDAVTLTSDFGTLTDPTIMPGDTKQPEGERLVLSTVHQAKGLEWDQVFVSHLAEGYFPSERAYEENNGLAEERRLFYVAVTRAKTHLYLSYPLTSGFDMVTLRQPSTFIDEIPGECLEKVRLKTEGGSGWSSGQSFGSGFAKGGAKSPKRSFKSDDWEEPTIVLDPAGDRVVKTPPLSYLRSIDEL